MLIVIKIMYKNNKMLLL